MKVWALTGGIGMGKSTATAMLRRLRIPVFDADAAVHRLQGPGGAAVRPIEATFPGTTRPSSKGPYVDREALRKVVLGNEPALRKLEAIVHPLVRKAEQRFLAAARRRGTRLAVLDIPLLFETGGEKRVDKVLVVTAPPAIQRTRVLRRPGMTKERLKAILARQVPDSLRRRRADHLVHSGLSRHFAQRAIRRLVASSG
ncbi:dephospho-CoA kinase [Roseomonas sp. SSH11]|uniref:Dephospho-CoA kinase n=1 Tax=Pararoseomonas baculiformis TaxID=2820812 RepID=A0ABS4ACL2_9PROT|nr:dephospho-CoA kinase [Pararoseomonas baculiformis]MBP0444733.1 dephospho-CoA kinase [Pararoseomonas baculiformis]